MLPILRYQNKKQMLVYLIFIRAFLFYRTFTSHQELIEQLSILINGENLMNIKKDILNQMLNEIKFNKNFYKNILEH